MPTPEWDSGADAAAVFKCAKIMNEERGQPDMKNRSIKTAILVPALSVLAVGIAIMVVVVNIIASSRTNDLSRRLVSARVNEFTNAFTSLSIESYGMVEAVTPLIQNLSTADGGSGDREEVYHILEDVLATNETMLGIWTCWEPNAFDGDDREYANTTGSDASGRLVPYVFRDGNGYSMEALTDYDTSEYYVGARDSGKPYITEPYSYSVGGQDMVLYSVAVPILLNGKVAGVVGADITLQAVNDIFNAASILDDGYLFVLSPGGLVSSHPKSENLLLDYRDTWLNGYAQNVDSVLAGGEDYIAQVTSDVEEVMFLASGVQIGDTGRTWAVCGLVPMDNVSAAATSIMVVILGIGLALVLLVGVIIFLIVRKQLAGLPRLTQTAKALAVGNIDDTSLDTSGNENSKNEIVQLSHAFAQMASGIKEQADALDQIAGGDYSMSVPIRSEEDVMNKSLNRMLDSTNKMLGDIRESSEQVAAGASQIADGATSLATGSTQQAATIEEFSATIETVQSQAERCEQTAESTRDAINRADALMGQGLTNMEELAAAMQTIEASSSEIAKVIKVIDDIAFQTNILALNAAVEAARAGQHGKGFAVVADEVRNLASKSAAAAKETGELIQNSVENVTRGTEVMERTSASLKEAGVISRQNAEEMGSLSEMAGQQRVAVQEINVGIGQISQVVQANSATAEESAASAEEMSAQSALLNKIVANFRLRGGEHRALPGAAQAAAPGPGKVYVLPPRNSADVIF